MKSLAREFLFGLGFILAGALLCAAAQADDRITRIALAWNAGDQAATQQDFDRNAPREMAELGSIVKGRLTVEKVVPIDMSLYQLPDTTLARVDIDGEKHIWILDNCKDGIRYCGFFHRAESDIPYIGHMEYGQAFDVATTAAGLSSGFVEGNPIGGSPAGLAWILGYKAFWIAYSRSAEMDLTTCIGTRHAWAVFGYGSGMKNLATLAGAGTGLGIGLGILAAVAMHETALEESLWECARFELG